MPQIHVQMPQGDNIIIKNTNGTKPNQQNWKKFVQNNFFPIPLKINATLGFKQFRTKSKELK